ncbi:SH3 domain-containing protein [Nocardia brasiliensis]|uniref:Uncharacterized protein n=2 Tax=Nocardia brasiliensis TaxID=37326 RepID=K0F4S8_NOCB7|nr:SH3 domain-containing protein [Nocardia brasiliensis]AFU02541.1 hypothetical protein O3I_022930 [Nocardia brasiliensis ATCC 700358]OCF86496.1 hypothetical protein AW168_30930 [Nocardia brasiliensis]
MSSKMFEKAVLGAAIGALSATALVVTAEPAGAVPVCGQYGFNTQATTIDQSNGWLVYFLNSGDIQQTHQGRAITSMKNGANLKGGNISDATITGRDVRFTIQWDDTGFAHYSGRVDDDGFARGLGSGAAPSASAWSSTRPFPCLSQQNVATVTEDVDVYDAPGGAGDVLGVLRQGQQVTLVGNCNRNDWCQVTGPAVPGGTGWVWGALQF